jgi:colanic acid/amylovoran biosynthesis glycosyltransferase
MMSAVHCVSEAIAAEATEFGLRRNKTVVIRPSVDIEYFKTKQSRARPDGPVRFVSTGALTWGKGWEYLLLAVKYALNSGCQICLDIIGEGPDRQRVEYAIYDLGLSHNVSLLGSLPPTTVRNRLQGADVFVLASLSEGISNAALEGMACGLPVVTTDCGGMTEAVADGEEGFVVPTRDSAGLAEAIVKFASDTELRLSMGARARARVERDFSLAQQTQEFIDLYSRLLSASAS